jgi:hypothetical protein
LLFLVIAIAILPGRFFAQSQNGSNSGKPALALTLAARTSSVKAGSPVWVDAHLLNVSDHRISLYKALSEDMDQGGWVYQVDVRDDKGSTPPKTKFANTVGASADGGYVPLDAGKDVTQSVNVSKLYDLSKPGKYSIQFRRFEEETRTFIVSNAVKVLVVP